LNMEVNEYVKTLYGSWDVMGKKLKRSLWLMLRGFLRGPTVDGCYSSELLKKSKTF